MSELNDHHPDPNRGTYRPSDNVPEDSVVGNSPLWHGHQAPKPPKKRHTLRIIGIVVGSLIAILILAAVLSPGQPAKEATAPAVVKPVDNGPTPDPVVTPTNKPQPSPRVTHKPAPPMTASQVQAIGSAESYLSFTAFSRKGLIHQLSSDAGEGFSVKDATYAVDHITVDWNEQAAKSALSYLSMEHFSRKGLIHQLESAYGEQFTHSQAVYGVTKAGL